MGGAAFVASLLYFLYFYFVQLGRPAPGGNWPGALAANVALFGLFALHHSVMARPWAKRALARVLAPELERTTYVWVSSALLAMVCLFWQPLAGTVYRVQGAGRWALYAVQLFGIVLTLRASARLDVLELAGIRQVRERRRERPPSLVGLQMTGPYTLVRHPVYLGWVVMVTATPDMTMNRLAFSAISILYLAAAVPFEERSLEAAFGDSYREYRRKVRWRFLPGIY